MSPRDALLLILDQVDYTAGACQSTEMVGAVLSVVVINLARAAVHDSPLDTLPENGHNLPHGEL